MTDSQQLKKIHHTSLRILAELGFHTEHTEMQERLVGLGCRVSDQRVFIPPDLVERTVQALPGSFRLYGRDDHSGVSVDAHGPFLCTNTGILPNLYDFETHTIRRSTRRDVETSTRLLDALSELDIVYVSLLDATEAPSHMITLVDFAATLANTTKPLVGPGLVNGDEARAVIQMALTLRDGDPQELAARPPCAPFIGSITPLRFPAGAVQALIEVAQAGLPFLALTNPVAGATAPYTISSSVALGHAEVLAWAVMAHAVRPGLPVVSFNSPSIADMRTLAATTGGPETALARRLTVELARFLGMPSWAHGHTSSTGLDLQAADEKSINQMWIAQAQPSLLGGLGGLANVTLTSYETLVLDNERFGALRRLAQGVAVDDDHLGYPVIADLVQGGDVISHAHTLQFLRSAEFWQPRLARRYGLVNGLPDPLSSLERARAEVRRILDGCQVEPLAAHIQSEIEAILQDRESAQE